MRPVNNGKWDMEGAFSLVLVGHHKFHLKKVERPHWRVTCRRVIWLKLFFTLIWNIV